LFAIALFMLQGGISNMNPLYIAMSTIGIGLMVYGLLKAKVQDKADETVIGDIKQKLIKIKNIQKETAIDQSKRVWSKEIVRQIFTDIGCLFGLNITDVCHGCLIRSFHRCVSNQPSLLSQFLTFLSCVSSQVLSVVLLRKHQLFHPGLAHCDGFYTCSACQP